MNVPARGIPLRPDRDSMFAEERQSWGRALAALVIANRDCVDPEPVLKAIWPDDRHAAARLKSAVSPISTGNTPALLLDVVQAFRSLAPASAALALFEKGLQVDLRGINTITLPSLANMPPAGVFVQEGAPGPNLMFDCSTGAVVGPTRKILLLAAASGELENAAPRDNVGRARKNLGMLLRAGSMRQHSARKQTMASRRKVFCTTSRRSPLRPLDRCDEQRHRRAAPCDRGRSTSMAPAASLSLARAPSAFSKPRSGRASTMGCSRRLACRQKPSSASPRRRLLRRTLTRRESKCRRSPAVRFEGSDPLPIADPGSPPTVATPVSRTSRLTWSASNAEPDAHGPCLAAAVHRQRHRLGVVP